MSSRDELLENRLARLAAGESLESCLADYPEQAEWLRSYLSTAQQLHSLPPQQPHPAANQAIKRRLQQAIHDTAEHAPRQVNLYFWEEAMNMIARFLKQWLPRIVVAGTAVALLIFAITYFTDSPTFLSDPDTEPAAVTLPTSVTTVGDTTITLEAEITADPGEVPLYQAIPEPVPTTPEAALAWAQEFGLTGPQIYRSQNEQDPGIYVLGSDGQRLIFFNFGGFGQINYAFPAAGLMDGEPLPFAEAAEAAIAFLSTHNLLPTDYHIEPAMGDSGPIRQVLIQPKIEEGVISGDSGLRLGVNASGQVVHASLSRLQLESAGNTTVISAEAAYEDLLASRNVLGSTYSRMATAGVGYRTYWPPAPTWEVGQTVDLTGYAHVLVHAETDAPLVELSGPDQVSYLLSGEDLAAISEQAQQGAVQVQGTITAQNGSNGWQVAVEDWQAVSPDEFNTPCLIGALSRVGDAVRFVSEAGDEYGLPHAPEDITEGEQMEVCATPAELGADLVWYHISVPPQGPGIPAGGVVTEQMVVEEAVEVAVTRVVTVEEVGEEGGSGLIEAIPVPVATAEFIEPTDPYEIGDEVTLTGVVQLFRIIDGAGEERLEATFRNDGDQGEATYPLTYALLATPELLEEMAEFHELHIRVYGRVVPLPDTEMYMRPHESQAIEVDSFDRPWPEERMERFLGHGSIEEIEGKQVLVFTDHATDEQYVLTPIDFPPQAYEHDPLLQEEQVLLTGVVHSTDSFGGLPLLERRGSSTGPDIAAAADVSELPIYDHDRIPVIDESRMAPRDGVAGVLHGDVIIERVALLYPYQLQGMAYGSDSEESGLEPVLLEPVWAFYGRSADGTEQFIIWVRAIAEN